MSELKAAASRGNINLPTPLREKLYAKNWVVYAKRPFGGPKQVIEYLGRYSHKVAISNFRIKSVSEKAVKFSWKDYKTGGTKKLMTLSPLEFLRRFCLHLLPDGFMRIRHYGILSSRGRVSYIPHLQLDRYGRIHKPTKSDLRAKALSRLKIDTSCPCCKKGTMRRLLPFARGDPPTAEQIKKRISFLQRAGF